MRLLSLCDAVVGLCPVNGGRGGRCGVLRQKPGLTPFLRNPNRDASPPMSGACALFQFSRSSCAGRERIGNRRRFCAVLILVTTRPQDLPVAAFYLPMAFLIR